MKNTLFLFCLVLALHSYAQPTPPAATTIEPQLLHQDLEALYQQLQSNHPKLFAYYSKAASDQQFNKLKKAINRPMERLEFLRLISPFVSSFRDGHTYMDINFEDEDFTRYAQSGGKFFPLQVIIIGNELYCLNNPFATGELQRGDEIISINQQPVSRLLPALRTLMSADGDETANANVQRLFGYMLWLHGQTGQAFTVQYKQGKKVRQEELPGISQEQLMDQLFKKSGPVRKLHLYPEHSLAVVEINVYNQQKEANAFIDSCFQVIKSKGLKNVALDLRRNGGGSSAIGAYFLAHVSNKPTTSTIQKSWRLGPLVQALDSTHWVKQTVVNAEKTYTREDDFLHSPIWSPEAPGQLQDSSLFVNARFFLLTSATTYSSAHMTALSVKCGGLGTIIGQPTGERLDLTGEVLSYQLPHTRFTVVIPAAAYKSACGDGNLVGVEPDVRVTFTPEDLRTGRDPELAMLKRLIEQQN